MKCGIEFDEWMMVGALIRQNDTVLELGARYGTTSCSLAAATRNTGHIVSVGPDGQALPFLLQNRLHCSVAVLHGAVGDRRLKFSRSNNPDGYGSSTSLAPERGGLTTHVPMPTWSVGKLETRFGWRFDVALIDCEGCIETALSARFAHPGRESGHRWAVPHTDLHLGPSPWDLHLGPRYTTLVTSHTSELKRSLRLQTVTGYGAH